MNWTDFRLSMESHLGGVEYDRAELIDFIDANHGPIDDLPDPALWASRFVAMLRERDAAATASIKLPEPLN
jgi:hypothetical protein